LYDINPKTKPEITRWWSLQPFNLDIHPDEGNCDNCWKKDIKRLIRNAIRNPHSFDWWQWMTDDYGWYSPRPTDLLPPFNFYRGNISPADIRALAMKSVEEINRLALTETYSSCTESCEAF
jgi:hypothetical protein